MNVIKCGVCDRYAEEGYSPDEQRWVECDDMWYCPDCYDVNEYGEVIIDEKIKPVELKEYYDNLTFESSKVGHVKSIAGTLKESGHHISINWIAFNTCVVSINHSVDMEVNGYISLIRVIEKYIYNCMYVNEAEDSISTFEFMKYRNFLLERIWQALKYIAGGRFASDNVFLSLNNRFI